MSNLAARRKYDDLHQDRPFHDGTFTSWAKEADRDHPFRYDDGVTVWVSSEDLTPDDDFLSRSG